MLARNLEHDFDRMLSKKAEISRWMFRLNLTLTYKEYIDLECIATLTQLLRKHAPGRVVLGQGGKAKGLMKKKKVNGY